MAAQKGLDMLVYADSDGAGTYVLIGGIQTNSLNIDKEDVDVTSQDDTSRWRQLLAGAGVKSIDFSGSGVFKDDTGIGKAMDYTATDIHRNWRFVIPSFRQIQGPFSVKMSFDSEHSKEVRYSLTAASAGDMTITSI